MTKGDKSPCIARPNGRKLGRRAVLTFLAGAAASSVASAQTAPADLEALVRAARAEGEVTLYSAATENVAARVARAFEQRYGIRMRFLRLGSTPLLQRYATEAEAGNIVADLVITGGRAVPFATQAIEKGWVEPIGAAGLPVIAGNQYPQRFNRTVAALAQVQLWMMAYNTERISRSEAPRDWPDLGDPKYRNQVILTDVTVSDAYVEFWALIRERYGDGLFERLSAQNPRRFNAGVPALQALAAGEGAIQAPVTAPQVKSLQDRGAPLEVVRPAFTTGVEMQLILTSRGKARHPNAGRLLANYLLSPEGNAVLNDDPGSVSVYDTTSFPAEYRSPDPNAVERTAEIRGLLGF